MTPSAQSAPSSRFKVKVKGWPIMGFVDHDKSVFPRMPVEPHYRRPIADRDSDIPDEWFTSRQLEEDYGLVPADYKKWRKRKRVRTDLTSALFFGAVVAAETEYHAREVFKREYNLLDTAAGNWQVEQVHKATPLGPCEPVKMRGLLQAAS